MKKRAIIGFIIFVGICVAVVTGFLVHDVLEQKIIFTVIISIIAGALGSFFAFLFFFGNTPVDETGKTPQKE
ncbi:MAG: hypothetical protein KBB75_02585 [Candidatus Pacebacteria bacterium]|jgi:phosphate/sulfate permease|nr:hypothetical protein [Candidatus Paceibacterota bacterium]